MLLDLESFSSSALQKHSEEEVQEAEEENTARGGCGVFALNIASFLIVVGKLVVCALGLVYNTVM